MKGVEAHDKLPTRRRGEEESAVGLRGEQKKEKHKKGYEQNTDRIISYETCRSLQSKLIFKPVFCK
jgi:hypothetical protein